MHNDIKTKRPGKGIGVFIHKTGLFFLQMILGF